MGPSLMLLILLRDLVQWRGDEEILAILTMFLSCQKCPWLVNSYSAIWLTRSVGVTLSWILMTWRNMQLRHTNKPRYHQANWQRWGETRGNCNLHFQKALISLFLTDSQELQETIFMKSYKVGTYDIPSSRYTIKQIANGRMKPEITVIFIFKKDSLVYHWLALRSCRKQLTYVKSYKAGTYDIPTNLTKVRWT